MATFDRPRGKTPAAEQNMVFEEVSDDDEIVFEEVDNGETSGKDTHGDKIVSKEDPVLTLARDVLNAEQQVADARRKADGSRDGERKVLVAEFLLTKARVDQARHSAGLGKAKPGEVARLEAELQTAHQKLDALTGQRINAARDAAFARFGNDKSRVGPDTEELLQRLAS